MDIRQVLLYGITAALVLLLGGCGKGPEFSGKTVFPEEIVFPETTQMPTETLSVFPENEAVQTLVESFAESYFLRDREAMRPYLVESYGMLIDAYPFDAEPEYISWHLPDSVTAECAMRGSCVARLTFNAGNGRYDYLTIELVQENKQWKIQSYGLE